MASSSNRIPKKYALLVGINYEGSRNSLSTPVRDVPYIYQLLTSYFGYDWRDFTILTDRKLELPCGKKGIPTRSNIISTLRDIVKHASWGDRVFLFFAGRGIRVLDEDGDEEDGWDGALLPLDYKTKGNILDDELHSVIRRLKKGVQMTALFDANHSETGLDLPFNFRLGKGPNDMFIRGSSRWQRSKCSLKKMREYAAIATGMITMGPRSPFAAARAQDARLVLENTRRTRGWGLDISDDIIEGNVVLISSCRDERITGDRSSGGVLTQAFVHQVQMQLCSRYGLPTYMETLIGLRRSLKGAGISAQLSSSLRFDLNLVMGL